MCFIFIRGLVTPTTTMAFYEPDESLSPPVSQRLFDHRGDFSQRYLSSHRNKEKKKQMTKNPVILQEHHHHQNARASVVARHRSLWNRPQRGPEAAKSPSKSVTQQRRPFHDRVAAGSTSECMDAAAPKPGLAAAPWALPDSAAIEEIAAPTLSSPRYRLTLYEARAALIEERYLRARHSLACTHCGSPFLQSTGTAAWAPHILRDIRCFVKVKIWFQNRRTKWKKQDGISNAEAAELKIGEKAAKAKGAAAAAKVSSSEQPLGLTKAAGGAGSPLLPAAGSNSSSALSVNHHSFSGTSSAKPSPCGVSDLSNLSSSGDRTDDSSQHYPPSSDLDKMENGTAALSSDGVDAACRETSPSLSAEQRPFREATAELASRTGVASAAKQHGDGFGIVPSPRSAGSVGL
ncbi:hypothetical protein HPB50_018471 [Hyalomma asiaticum]|uniref:Uncharacterized protein n=1 Tax=Hyalomma asiaticum TaxID=266040 RepID=A0ACB7TJW6_HYAAI|nr:hypothetical protein HPB50_018471 [Hyalomma asiaticum]